ncbi:MAG: hypothetical protein ACPGU6_03515 [Tenacibaculum sp.]
MKKNLILLILIATFLSCKNDTRENQLEKKASQTDKIKPIKTVTEKTKAIKINCDINYLISFDSLLDSGKQIYDKDVFMFFSDIKTLCKPNFEYTKLENKVIFKLLSSETKTFVLFLENQEKETIRHILNVIENPINSKISLEEIKSKVEKLKVGNLEIDEFALKKPIIESLNIAIKSATEK